MERCCKLQSQLSLQPSVVAAIAQASRTSSGKQLLLVSAVA
jgi:hypothetical protein